MTNREKEVLALIKENPMISQNECSRILGISRSAIAGHIMKLTEKGYVKGKGYILKEDPYIVVIGGSNMDISGSPSKQFINRDSNPGTVSISAGGVGRNIAENLARLGCSVKLLSLLGNDLYGKQLLTDCKSAGIDMNHVKILDNMITSTYLSILDENKDMISAISSMEIMDHFDQNYLESNHRTIAGSSLILIDANLPESIIKYVTSKYTDIDIFVDTVSSVKAAKIKDNIGDFHTIKPNKIEAETLSGVKINNMEDMKAASRTLLKKGVKRVFLTLGEKGILYSDSEQSFIYENKKVKAVNTTGAGDAFTAGLAYSYVNNLSIKRTLDIASTASLITVMDVATINRDLNIKNIEKLILEMNNVKQIS